MATPSYHHHAKIYRRDGGVSHSLLAKGGLAIQIRFIVEAGYPLRHTSQAQSPADGLSMELFSDGHPGTQQMTWDQTSLSIISLIWEDSLTTTVLISWSSLIRRIWVVTYSCDIPILCTTNPHLSGNDYFCYYRTRPSRRVISLPIREAYCSCTTIVLWTLSKVHLPPLFEKNVLRQNFARLEYSRGRVAQGWCRSMRSLYLRYYTKLMVKIHSVARIPWTTWEIRWDGEQETRRPSTSKERKRRGRETVILSQTRDKWYCGSALLSRKDWGSYLPVAGLRIKGYSQSS